MSHRSAFRGIEPAAGFAAAGIGLVVALGLLVAMGGTQWRRGWCFAGLLLLGNGVTGALLLCRRPELLRRRSRFGAGTPHWDCYCLGALGLGALGTWIVGLLDGGRFGWHRIGGQAPWAAGALLYVFGQTLLCRAMLANPFFEKTARIQKDREHRPITTAVYAHVRHPGYVGVIAAHFLAAPLLLDSYWAFAPASFGIGVVIARTALEDRLLRRELPGYAAYATRVRWRLVPWIW